MGDARGTRASACRDEGFMRHAMDVHGAAVYRLALCQTHSRADAQDIAQDVFLRLLTSEKVFNGDEHLHAWLLRVTLNRSHELYRMPWKRRVVALDDETSACGCDDDPADAALERLEQSDAWKALQALPERMRVVAELYYVEECSTDRIAAVVGCAPATVRTRLHRARMQLRKTLDMREETHGRETA